MRNLLLRKASFFMAVVILAIAAPMQLSASSLKLIEEKTFDVSEGELLEVSTEGGDVIITTGSSNEVHVKISGSSKAADKMTFEMKKTGSGVYVEGKKKGSWVSNFFNFGGINLKYEIQIPEKYNVQVNTAGGDVSLVDLRGESSLKTSGGDIYTENLEGNLICTTSGGDIQAYRIYGAMKCTTSGGDIDVKGGEGQVTATTSGGDISLAYKGENKGINLATSGGDIDVAIPSDFKADVYLKTSGGDVDCNFEARVEEVSGSKFVGKIKGGGPELVCKTSGGDISVKDID